MKKTSELFEGPDSSLRKAFDEATQEDWKRIEKELVYVATYASPERRDDLLRFLKGQFQTILVAEIERAKAEERERGKQVVFLILPLAKGYAHQHDVGSNNRYIEIAENYLATPQDI